MDKLLEVLRSKNFLVTVINIAIGLFAANEVIVNVPAEDIYNNVAGKELMTIIVYLVVNFLNVFTKFAEKLLNKQWSFSFFLSWNFWTQALSILALVVAAYFDQTVAGIVIAVIMNVINLIKHVKDPAKKSPIVIDDIIGG
jgi:ABC-type proline/glycine betaine transport system permease subunit